MTGMRDRDDPELDDLEWLFEDFLEEPDTSAPSTLPASPPRLLSRRRR